MRLVLRYVVRLIKRKADYTAACAKAKREFDEAVKNKAERKSAERERKLQKYEQASAAYPAERAKFLEDYAKWREEFCAYYNEIEKTRCEPLINELNRLNCDIPYEYQRYIPDILSWVENGKVNTLEEAFDRIDAQIDREIKAERRAREAELRAQEAEARRAREAEEARGPIRCSSCVHYRSCKFLSDDKKRGCPAFTPQTWY